MDEIAEATLALGEGTRLQALFPVATATPEAEAGAKAAAKPAKAAGRTAKAAAKGKPVVNGGDSPHTETLKARLTELRGSGFNRLYQQGRIVEFSTPESLLDLDFTLPVFVLLDRIVVSSDNRSRIVDAAEIAYRESGEVVFEEVPRPTDEDLSVGTPKPREETRSASGTGSVAHSSAKAATDRARNRSRGCSASTIRLALPALPGIWEYGGLRPEPGDSGQGLTLADGAIDP